MSKDDPNALSLRAKFLGQKWRECKESGDSARFEQMAEDLRVQRNRELAAAGLPQLPRPKSKRKDDGQRRPLNSFLTFAVQWRQEHAHELQAMANKDSRQLSVKLGEIWKGMSLKEREPYIQQAQAQMKAYSQMHGTKRGAKRKADTINKPSITKVRKKTARKKAEAEAEAAAAAADAALSHDTGVEDSAELSAEARDPKEAQVRKEEGSSKPARRRNPPPPPRKDAASTTEFGTTHNLVADEDAGEVEQGSSQQADAPAANVAAESEVEMS